MDINNLQLLHIAAGKELRVFRNKIQHAEHCDKMAADMIDPKYYAQQADDYRKMQLNAWSATSSTWKKFSNSQTPYCYGLADYRRYYPCLHHISWLSLLAERAKH